MDDMRELIDERAVAQVLAALAIAGPLAGLALGALWAGVRRARLGLGLGRGLALGLLGTLTWAMWQLFGWLTRYQPAADPKNDYFGLERVDVLLLNVVIFAAVGAAVGLTVRAVRARDRALEAAPVAGNPDETKSDRE
jgi:hypothetical protein